MSLISRSATLLLALLPIGLSQGACQTYDLTFCKNTIYTYTLQGNSDGKNNKVFNAVPNIPLSFYEATLGEAGYSNLTVLGPSVLPECFLAAQKYFCGTTFPSCNSTTPAKIEICRSVCEDLITQCGTLFQQAGLQESLPKSCSIFPETNCETMSTLQNEQDFVCHDPLVPNPDRSRNSSACFGNCCVPCSIQNNFYKKGAIERLNIFLKVETIVSFFCTLFVFLSYSFLPGKREFPQAIVFFLSGSVLVWFSAIWLSIFIGDKAAYCSDSFYVIEGGNASNVCKAQGAIITYFVLASALWFAFLIGNIFMNVTFRKDLSIIWKPAHLVIWSLPLFSVIPNLAMNKISHRTGLWCHPEVGPWIQYSLLYPLGVILFSSFFLNLVTLYKIYVMTKDSNKSTRQILRIQIRPFMFSFTVIVILIAYWSYSQVAQRAADIEITEWSYAWLLCVQKGLGQNECHKIAKSELTHIGGIVIGEFSVHFTGIVLFIFFGMKKTIVNEWQKLVFPNSATIFDSTKYSYSKDKETTVNENQEMPMPTTSSSALHEIHKEKEKEKEKVKGEQPALMTIKDQNSV